jgi:hypothetical protein
MNAFDANIVLDNTISSTSGSRAKRYTNKPVRNKSSTNLINPDMMFASWALLMQCCGHHFENGI